MGLLIFIYPFAEIYAWIKFIDTYSFVDALYLLVTGGLVGSVIMTLQGRTALMSLMNSFQGAAAKGKSPANKIFHHALIWVGGLLIFLPGIISKVIGTALVLPGTRHLILLYIKSTLIAKISSGAFRVFTSGGFPGQRSNDQQGFDPFSGAMPYEPNPQERDVVDVTPIQVEHKNEDS